jgi:hypothetical protein
MTDQQQFDLQFSIIRLENASNSEISLDHMLKLANELTVTNDYGFKQAISMQLQTRKIRTNVDNFRKDLIKPHLDFQRAINKEAKKIEVFLDGIDSIVEGKSKAFIEQKSLSSDKFVTEDGTAKVKHVTSWELVDLNLVPREYLMVDETKVNQAIAFGLKNIAGISIKETEELQLRIKRESK